MGPARPKQRVKATHDDEVVAGDVVAAVDEVCTISFTHSQLVELIGSRSESTRQLKVLTPGDGDAQESTPDAPNPPVNPPLPPGPPPAGKASDEERAPPGAKNLQTAKKKAGIMSRWMKK